VDEGDDEHGHDEEGDEAADAEHDEHGDARAGPFGEGRVEGEAKLHDRIVAEGGPDVSS
jgi:hypothetical protein